jgi:hypothetical protein
MEFAADTKSDRRSAISSVALRRGVLALILVVVLGTIWSWPNVVPKNFGVVIPGKIYRSGELPPAALARVVRARGIRTVIDFGAWEPGSREERLSVLAMESLGVKRHLFWLEGDGSGDITRYLEALRLMRDPSTHPILLHCGAGSERTGCAVILYRHYFQGIDIDRAIEEARRYGHHPDRNTNFRNLVEYILEPVKHAYDNNLARVTLPHERASGASSGVSSGADVAR